jgi:hypothetical protein
VDCEGQTVEETVQALYNLYMTKIKGKVK